MKKLRRCEDVKKLYVSNSETINDTNFFLILDAMPIEEDLETKKKKCRNKTEIV